MQSSKNSLSDPEKERPPKPEKQASSSGRLKLNTMADLALLRLQNAAEAARKIGVAEIDESGANGWIVQFTPLTEQG